tara:strand:- start:304 stop:804 length:501 start_codon:yes stop_codon:yes gene_type:complete
MPVLISTKKGFINAVIEPQFQQFGTRTIVTLQFSDYEDARAMSRHLLGDTTFDQKAQLFPFTSFIQLDDLASFFKRKKLWTELQNIKVDFSPKPKAFYWVGYYTGEDLPEGEEFDENTYSGFCLAEDAEHLRWSFEESLDVLILYPLLTLPEELAESSEPHFELGV